MKRLNKGLLILILVILFVFLLSGTLSAEEEFRTILTADDHISKPFDMEELMGTVKKLLKKGAST